MFSSDHERRRKKFRRARRISHDAVIVINGGA
jgi:hypothetical protein